MTRRGMGKYGVDFITPQQMDFEVQQLMTEFGNAQRQIIEPPIPIDDIVELYLKLDFEIIDAKALFKVDGVFGALWVEDQKIGIDQSLDPHEHPQMLGRYHFTLAHEVGHWRLHRRKFQKRAVTQTSLLPDDPNRPNYICRDGDDDPIEVQADMFAAMLMMPEAMVRRVWHSQTEHGDPMSLDEIRANSSPVLQAEIERRLRFKTGPLAEENALFEAAAKPMADIFEVSPPAMRRRLQKLNLLVKIKEKTLFDGLE